MPVQKFRSVEEMNRPTWHEPGDPALYRSIKAVWNLGSRSERRREPGGRRFRSIAEMKTTDEKAY